MKSLSWAWHGQVSYNTAWVEQERRRRRVAGGDRDAEHLMLLTHPPVITMGKRALRSHIVAGDRELADRGIEVVRTNRGGLVTLHGPRQLMVYPIIRIGCRVVAHLERLGGAIAEWLAELGLPGAHWERERPGVWWRGRKLASCGVHVSRGVAIHGYAIDLATPPESWTAIVACGDRSGSSNLSVAEALAARGAPPPPLPSQAARALAPALCRALGRGALECPPSLSWQSSPESELGVGA